MTIITSKSTLNEFLENTLALRDLQALLTETIKKVVSTNSDTLDDKARTLSLLDIQLNIANHRPDYQAYFDSWGMQFEPTHEVVSELDSMLCKKLLDY